MAYERVFARVNRDGLEVVAREYYNSDKSKKVLLMPVTDVAMPECYDKIINMVRRYERVIYDDIVTKSIELSSAKSILQNATDAYNGLFLRLFGIVESRVLYEQLSRQDNAKSDNMIFPDRAEDAMTGEALLYSLGAVTDSMTSLLGLSAKGSRDGLAEYYATWFEDKYGPQRDIHEMEFIDEREKLFIPNTWYYLQKYYNIAVVYDVAYMRSFERYLLSSGFKYSRRHAIFALKSRI